MKINTRNICIWLFVTLSFVSCGQNNKFNHPSKEVLERLDKQKIEIFRTDELGTVTLTITKQDLIFKTAAEIRL